MRLLRFVGCAFTNISVSVVSVNCRLFYEWKNFLVENDAWYSNADEGDIKVDYVFGGCLMSEESNENVIRPNKKSLMRNDIPILGSVNKRWVESILNLFSGI